MDTGEAHSPPEGTPGARLRAYVNAHWGRRQGGIRGLAARMSTTAETMYEWFRDDREPSLRVSAGDAGRLLIHCFAGCTFADVVRALDDRRPVP